MKTFIVISCSALLLWGCQLKDKPTRVNVYATGETARGNEVIQTDGSVVFLPTDGTILLKFYRIEDGESKPISAMALSSADGAIEWLTPRMRDQNCEFSYRTRSEGQGNGGILTTFESPMAVGFNLMSACRKAADEELIFHYWIRRSNAPPLKYHDYSSLDELVRDSKSGEVSFVAVTCAKTKE